MARWHEVRVGGRLLEVLCEGPEDGFALVVHNGTPTAAAPFPPMERAAAASGLQIVTWSRPGYARSTRVPGRTVADVVGDTTAILDALGHDAYVTLGWSGGGPHALACAALHRGRCRAAAVMAGIAPWDAEGLDPMAGMAEENVTELSAAVAGEEPLRRFLDCERPKLAEVTGPQVAGALQGLVPPVDVAALTGEFADAFAFSSRRAMSAGVDGWLDDDLAFVTGWGFDLATIAVPVAVWQGDEDRMVPFAHGRWLAEHIPGAEAHLLAGEGHLSLAAQLERIVAGVAAAGGVTSSPAP